MQSPARLERLLDKANPTTFPRFNTQTTLRNWLQEIRLMTRSLDAQTERLEQLEGEISTYLASHCVSPIGESDTGLDGTEPMVYNMYFHPRDDGRAEIALDGGRIFTLSPQLAGFFLFIASGEKDRDAPGALVGWRTREAVLEKLQESAGRTYPRCYVNNLVNRLKDLIRKSGYSRRLIQTHGEKGVRLALMQGAKDSQHTPAR